MDSSMLSNGRRSSPPFKIPTSRGDITLSPGSKTVFRLRYDPERTAWYKKQGISREAAIDFEIKEALKAQRQEHQHQHTMFQDNYSRERGHSREHTRESSLVLTNSSSHVQTAVRKKNPGETMVVHRIDSEEKNRFSLVRAFFRLTYLFISIVICFLFIYIMLLVVYQAFLAFIDARVDQRVEEQLQLHLQKHNACPDIGSEAEQDPTPVLVDSNQHSDYVDYAQQILGGITLKDKTFKYPSWSTNELVEMQGRLGFWPSKSYWTKGTLEPRPPATVLIDKSYSPGCWPLKGSNGTLGIRFRESAKLDRFVIEHGPTTPLPISEIRVAPKQFQLSTLEGVSILNATYSGTQSVEYFPLPSGIVSQGVWFTWLSNHGANYTCIHRLRLEGLREYTPSDSVP